MAQRFLIVDVFAREPLAGNALAVVPDAASIDPERMQRIAREFNLSETTFVTRAEGSAYDVRIFTPFEEMPFAGHPTLGTAWTLRHLGRVSGDTVVQNSPAGETPVTFEGRRVWLERGGDPGSDIVDFDDVLVALDLDPTDVGFDPSAIGGKSADLQPAIADAGVPIYILPMGDPERVARLTIPTLPEKIDGIYCVAPLGKGRVKVRFFGAGYGVAEDPGTGGAAAALGVYLGARTGAVDVEIEQGVEIGRPSFLSLQASPGKARVGGEVHLSSEGSLY